MKALFRLASALAALFSFVFIVVDGTTSISVRALVYTSFGDFVSRLLQPGALDRLAASVARNIHPLVWSLINLVVFLPPAVINLAVLALIFWLIGRRREERLGLSDRR